MKFKCVYLNLSFINIKMLLILHLFDYHLIVVNILHIYPPSLKHIHTLFYLWEEYFLSDKTRCAHALK